MPVRKMLCRSLFAASAALLSLLGSAARADYLAETGAIQVIAPPPSVQLGALQSNTVLPTFAENRRITLASSVAVDDTASGIFASKGSLVGGTIAAGTRVDSYFFHSDPVSRNQDYDGTVTFSTAILGVIVLSDTLDATDAQLGHAGTSYPISNGRGLELDPAEDFFALSADRRTLTLHFSTHGNVDEVRVVTAASAVPEPGSAALLGTGAAIVAWAGAARRRRAATITA